MIEVPDEAAFARHQRRDARRSPSGWTPFSAPASPPRWSGFFRSVIEFINQLERPVFARRHPLRPQRGHRPAAAAPASAPTVTATFAFPKIGHVVFPGAEFTGPAGSGRHRHPAAHRRPRRGRASSCSRPPMSAAMSLPAAGGCPQGPHRAPAGRRRLARKDRCGRHDRRRRRCGSAPGW
ncbi:MAG: hypothetical protein MZV70_56935 [Desulfobacterales bacterium]|nr:hypothetical protein [Desulfobacterales bacterium]